MESLQVSLFHQLTVRVGPRSIEIRSSKVRDLLCYLILFRHESHSREVLAEQLWNGIPPTQSRQYLRKALWQLRELFRRELDLEPERLLMADHQWIRLNETERLELDVVAFEKAYEGVRAVSGTELSSEQAAVLRAASELYKGGLLEGCYHDWCLQERERLQFMYLSMLDRLIDYALENGEYEEGVRYCMRSLDHEPTRERTHRVLMKTYARAGDRNAALAQYERCTEILEDELGVEPDARTTELYLHLCAESGADVETLIRRLEGYRTALNTMHRQVDQDLTRLDRVLNEVSGNPTSAQAKLVLSELLWRS